MKKIEPYWPSVGNDGGVVGVVDLAGEDALRGAGPEMFRALLTPAAGFPAL